MAQPDDARRTTPRPQNSPGTKSSKTQSSPNAPRLQGESSNRSPIPSPNPRRIHDHDDHGHHPNKKSVFMKVKEKARKLKKSLSGRRRREENELRSPSITSPGSAGPVEDDSSEYFASPLCGPPVAKEDEKSSSEKHESTATLETADSKHSGLTISTREGAEPAKKSEGKGENLKGSPQQQDKGVSVKEYLMQKLEPGEDERALSQVITQTISPRCEKMKEAVNSLLKTEEPSRSPKTSNSELDITPSATDSDQNIEDTLATKSPNVAMSSLSSSADPNSLESKNTTQNPGSTSDSLKTGSNSDPNRSNP